MKDIQIGDVGLNASYFKELDSKEAVKELVESTANPGTTQKERQTWADKAYKVLSESADGK